MILRPKSSINYKEEPYFSWFEKVNINNWRKYIRYEPIEKRYVDDIDDDDDTVIYYLDDSGIWIPQFIVKLSLGKGRGLFAARRIDAHQSITVYIGESLDICRGNAYTLTNIDETMTVRADKRLLLGGAHFINEGETPRTRNCEIGPNFIFESTKVIEYGEEILTFYGEGYQFRDGYNVFES